VLKPHRPAASASRRRPASLGPTGVAERHERGVHLRPTRGRSSPSRPGRARPPSGVRTRTRCTVAGGCRSRHAGAARVRPGAGIRSRHVVVGGHRRVDDHVDVAGVGPAVRMAARAAGIERASVDVPRSTFGGPPLRFARECTRPRLMTEASMSLVSAWWNARAAAGEDRTCHVRGPSMVASASGRLPMSLRAASGRLVETGTSQK